MDIIVRAGADVNFPSNVPPVLEAAKYGHNKCVDIILVLDLYSIERTFCLNDFIWQLYKDQELCMDILLHIGADMSAGLSPAEATLLVSIANCDTECVISLISAVADINFTYECHTSPLMVAAAAGPHAITCLKLLLTLGAHVNKKNVEGKNALQICIARSHEIRRDKCMLLFVAGEQIDLTANIFNFLGSRYIIPDYLKQLDNALCLKDLCRIAIRKHLISLNEHQQLFGRIAQLGQPSLICSFLLYDMSLD